MCMHKNNYLAMDSGKSLMWTSGDSWGELRRKAKDRQQCLSLVMALRAQGHEEDQYRSI